MVMGGPPVRREAATEGMTSGCVGLGLQSYLGPRGGASGAPGHEEIRAWGANRLQPTRCGPPSARGRCARHRGVRRVDWMFICILAAYNLVRIRNLTGSRHERPHRAPIATALAAARRPRCDPSNGYAIRDIMLGEAKCCSYIILPQPASAFAIDPNQLGSCVL